MANASEILGDNKIIRNNVYNKHSIKIYSDDDEIAILIKTYIIKASCRYMCNQYIFNNKWNKYIKEYNECLKPIRPKHWRETMAMDFMLLKINHYRQKFWYWKKLKE